MALDPAKLSGTFDGMALCGSVPEVGGSLASTVGVFDSKREGTILVVVEGCDDDLGRGWLAVGSNEGTHVGLMLGSIDGEMDGVLFVGDKDGGKEGRFEASDGS